MKLTELQQLVLARLRSTPEEWLKAVDISKTVNANPRSIGCALNGLFKTKTVTRTFVKGVSVWRLSAHNNNGDQQLEPGSMDSDSD